MLDIDTDTYLRIKEILDNSLTKEQFVEIVKSVNSKISALTNDVKDLNHNVQILVDKITDKQAGKQVVTHFQDHKRITKVITININIDDIIRWVLFRGTALTILTLIIYYILTYYNLF
jgi:hypothetical protein